MARIREFKDDLDTFFGGEMKPFIGFGQDAKTTEQTQAGNQPPLDEDIKDRVRGWKRFLGFFNLL